MDTLQNTKFELSDEMFRYAAEHEAILAFYKDLEPNGLTAASVTLPSSKHESVFNFGF
jgi:hypothetical protein